VWWPLDDAWYGGEVTGYNTDTKMHNVLYYDGIEAGDTVYGLGFVV
jgi:hypothetical protein